MDHEVFHRPLSALSRRKAHFIAADLQTSEAVVLMQAKDEPCLLVGTAEAVEGILTERDLLLKVAGKDAKALQAPVADYMTPNPETLDVEASVQDALRVMATGGYRHIPVTRDGTAIGLVSVTDVIDFLVIQFPEQILNPWFDIKPGDPYG